MKIIDAHAHIFSGINGRKRGKKTAAAKYGKILYGEEKLTFLPPFFRDIVFTADMLVETMDFTGVSKAVLLQNPVIGIINHEIRDAMERFPDRFAGTIQVDPMKSDACNLISEFVSEKQNTLKFEISEEWGWCGNYKGFSLVNKEMMKIWELLAKLKMRVIIDTGEIFNKGYQVENIELVSKAFPEVKILMEHLGFLSTKHLDNSQALKRRTEMLQLGKKYENVYFGFSSIAAFINDEYPCTASLELIKEAIEIVGADKILWGSDIPSTLKKYTYTQMVDVAARHASFLSKSEKHAIMYGNAEAFFFNS